MSNFENLIILYGSQTGNSQDLSERIWRKAKYLKLTAHLRSFDRFDLTKLSNDKVKLLCVCSTTGQGDVPDNMTKFWKKIMKKNMPNDSLQNVEFCVIGLGDSSYEKYNFIAKKLYKRFIQLGATPLLDSCLCDDQQNDGLKAHTLNGSKTFGLP
jgi:sulfite reductase alpha subunit-like flavoprotein